MRTIGWETASQLALRNCSQKVNICDFGEGGVHAIKHVSYKRFSSGHKLLMSS